MEKAKDLGLTYFETASFTGDGVDQCVHHLLSHLIVNKLNRMGSNPELVKRISAGEVKFIDSPDAVDVPPPTIRQLAEPELIRMSI